MLRLPSWSPPNQLKIPLMNLTVDQEETELHLFSLLSLRICLRSILQTFLSFPLSLSHSIYLPLQQLISFLSADLIVVVCTGVQHQPPGVCSMIFPLLCLLPTNRWLLDTNTTVDLKVRSHVFSTTTAIKRSSRGLQVTITISNRFLSFSLETRLLRTLKFCYRRQLYSKLAFLPKKETAG